MALAAFIAAAFLQGSLAAGTKDHCQSEGDLLFQKADRVDALSLQHDGVSTTHESEGDTMLQTADKLRAMDLQDRGVRTTSLATRSSSWHGAVAAGNNLIGTLFVAEKLLVDLNTLSGISTAGVTPTWFSFLTVFSIFGLSALLAAGLVWPLSFQLAKLNGQPEEIVRPIRPTMLWARFVTLVTSFAEGYGFYVASSLMIVIGPDLGLGSLQVTAFQSLTYVVMPAGSLLTGPLADALGRVTMLVLSNVSVGIGAMCMALSRGYMQLMLGRTIEALGFGMGFAVIMIYMTEISPKHARGHFTGLEEAMNTLGMLAGVSTNHVLLGIMYDWRWAISFAALAPTVMLILISSGFVPESPRWLKLQGKHEAAEKGLRLLLADREAEEVLAHWATNRADASPRTTSAPWADVLMPASSQDRHALVAALVVQSCQMLCGIAALMTHMPAMLKVHGDTSSVMQAMVLILLARLAAVIFSANYLVDAWGRRPLLLVSLLGTLLGTGLLGASCWLPTHTIFAGEVSSFVIFCISFACGLGPVPWAYVGEVVQTKLRSKAVAIIFAISRLEASILIFLVGVGRARIGDSMCFLFLAALNALGLLLAWTLVVETRATSIEHVPDLFCRSQSIRSFRLNVGLVS